MEYAHSHNSPDYDVIIIGAGPAGISAAMWCADLGLSAIVLEKHAEPGGQLLWIYNPITNYPGIVAKNGRELRDRFIETFCRFNVPMILSAEVIEIDHSNLMVTISDGRKFSANSVVLAAGVRRRRLEIPGEDKFQRKGIIESGSRDKHIVQGKTVAIIGGGDGALENALILADHAAKVYLIHRRDKFTAREIFIKQVIANPKIQIVLNTVATEIDGLDSLQSLTLLNQKTQISQCLITNFLLIRIGVQPNSDLLKIDSDVDANGYIVINALGESTRLNTFAIGDIAHPASPTIATSTGSGAAIAKHLLRCRKK